MAGARAQRRRRFAVAPRARPAGLDGRLAIDLGLQIGLGLHLAHLFEHDSGWAERAITRNSPTGSALVLLLPSFILVASSFTRFKYFSTSV